MLRQSERPDSQKEKTSEKSSEKGGGITILKTPYHEICEGLMPKSPKKESKELPHFDKGTTAGGNIEKDYKDIEKGSTDKSKDYEGIADASKDGDKDYSGLDEKISEEMGRDIDGIDESSRENTKDYDYINESYGDGGGERWGSP